jgi:hypothetical protein
MIPTFDIIGEDHDQLEALLPILLRTHNKSVAVIAWQTTDDGTLRLATTLADGWTPFPQPLSPATLGGFLRGYLQTVDYGRPDFQGDGTNARAWQIQSGGWTHVMSVTPTWRYYGK